MDLLQGLHPYCQSSGISRTAHCKENILLICIAGDQLLSGHTAKVASSTGMHLHISRIIAQVCLSQCLPFTVEVVGVTPAATLVMSYLDVCIGALQAVCPNFGIPW